MKILGVAPRNFFENTILQSEDTHWCGRRQAAVHWEEDCVAKCERQSSCDTFGWAGDEHKLLSGEAWECYPGCGSIVCIGSCGYRCESCGSSAPVEACYRFLDELRESGETNMWGAASFLQREFKHLKPDEVNKVLIDWMQIAGERRKGRWRQNERNKKNQL